ncbi:phosphopantothenoylcysteine decarboxylase domain-containing protein, partial [Streptococcus pyogenes]
MKILITSGGTRESIDQVRSITNHSTGQLGKQIAERFL